MTLIATDELTDGQLIELPPEAGDVNQPRFEPVEAWLKTAVPAAQKTAMWRWFATRFEELEAPASREDDGSSSADAQEEPVQADAVLQERFSGLVPGDVLDALIAGIQSRTGNTWAKMKLDKLGS